MMDEKNWGDNDPVAIYVPRMGLERYMRRLQQFIFEQMPERLKIVAGVGVECNW